MTRPGADRGSLPQAERAYLEIKAQIARGVYRPGAHLSEATLARVHKASRTPVREALSRLREDGYVVSEPGRGFLIAPVTVARVAQLLEARRLLDGGVAAAAARVATPEEVERIASLAQCAERSEDPGSRGVTIDRNLRFHRALAQASHNQVYVEMVEHCLMELGRILSLGARLRPFRDGAAADHEAIVQAVRERDEAAAAGAAARHVDRTRELVTAAVLSGEIRGVVV